MQGNNGSSSSLPVDRSKYCNSYIPNLHPTLYRAVTRTVTPTYWLSEGSIGNIIAHGGGAVIEYSIPCNIVSYSTVQLTLNT